MLPQTLHRTPREGISAMSSGETENDSFSANRARRCKSFSTIKELCMHHARNAACPQAACKRASPMDVRLYDNCMHTVRGGRSHPRYACVDQRPLQPDQPTPDFELKHPAAASSKPATTSLHCYPSWSVAAAANARDRVARPGRPP
jgi:hypothetical protein